jgi:endonuclease/exonuclease/phosphatase (EEP) superfamily protein YafD
MAVWTLSVALILATLLPTIRTPTWWIRVWDYPRLQLAAGLALAATAQLALLRPAWPCAALLAVTMGCLCWQTWRIHPYTRLRRVQVLPAKQSDQAHTITLLIANVLQENRDADTLLRLVAEADPDLVLTLETNGWWDAQLTMGLRDRYSYAVCRPLENTYGMHLFSRLELRDVVVRERVAKDIPSIHAHVVLRSGVLVDLHCLHPEPPLPGNDVAERDAELLLVATDVKGDGRPTIVCGDLNDVAWSHTTRLFQRLSGMLDPRVGRGLFPTFHADHPLARWPLDHVFHDPDFRLARLQVLRHFGSDHFPVLVSLVHAPAVKSEEHLPAADAEDHREAAEKITEGRKAAAERGR